MKCKLDTYIENVGQIVSSENKKFIFIEDYLVKNMTEYNSHADELTQISGTETGE